MKVVIFGRAQGVWEELAAAQELCAFDRVIAIGSAGVDYPGCFDHWVSFHTGLFPHWIELRRGRGLSLPRDYWSTGYRGRWVRHRKYRVDDPRTWPVEAIDCAGGSSGLIATMGALKRLHADRIVLAGIPMEAARGQYDTRKPWDEAKKHQQAWLENLPLMQGRVRSMSGWTQKLLGAPTPDWLRGESVAA